MRSRALVVVGIRFGAVVDAIAWSAARAAVGAVRYQPRQLQLRAACAASHADVPEPVVRWLADTRMSPWVSKASTLPHDLVRAVAAQAAHWFGPTASALVRWFSGAIASAADRISAETIDQPLRGLAHPGMLVPHQHEVAVVAVDMRGFTNLTRVLDDSLYLTDLLEEYLSELTRVVEGHRGLVYQYTGDGLLALYLPELAGMKPARMLNRVVYDMGSELHGVFDAMHERWLKEWRAQARPIAEIGLGVGVSFGQATIGFVGPAGKKQVGVIGEPINQAAFLCSQARAGTLLVDRESFTRAGGTPPAGDIGRLRSKKAHQRIQIVCLPFGERARRRTSRWRPDASFLAKLRRAKGD
jgi:class 3 adenylate cyclase